MSQAELWGPLVGPVNVEEAVIATLREWMPAYLRRLEELNSLPARSLGRPPTPESYHGGLDWESQQQDTLPEVIVLCNPVGEPERMSSAIVQSFLVQVGCVVEGTVSPEEQTARKMAGLWAAASMLLVHHADLGAFKAEDTILVAAPKVEMLDSENRRFAVGVTGFHVFAQVLDPNAGPLTVKAVEPEGPYPEAPEVKEAKETVKAELVSETVH